MGFERLRIFNEISNEEFEVMFNPEDGYSLDKSNNFASQTIPGLSSPLLQFVSGNLQTLSMELFFDTSIERTDVRDATSRIENLMVIDSEFHAPPVLRITWGTLQFRCVLAQVTRNFTKFLEDGRPIRARLNVTFNEIIDPEREVKELNLQTADFSKAHIVRQGETLTGIAELFYENPQLWRPIALANEIDTPLSIAPGQELLIPSLPFIDPETGEVIQ
jgi:hypothetical protein